VSEKHHEVPFRTAGALAEDCRRLLAGEPIQGKRLSPYERTIGRLKRRFGLYLVYGLYAFVLGLVALALGVAYMTFVVDVRDEAEQQLRECYLSLTAEVPQDQAESAILAGEEALRHLDLAHLMGSTKPRPLNADSIVQKRDEFQKQMRQFKKDYHDDYLPKELKNEENEEDSQDEDVKKRDYRRIVSQSKFVSRVARLRAGKALEVMEKRGLSAEAKIERQYLVALEFLVVGDWLEANEAFGRLERLSNIKTDDEDKDAGPSTLRRRFHELSKVMKVLLVVMGRVNGPKTVAERIDFIQQPSQNTTRSAFLAGVYTYLKLRVVELETLDVIFKKGRSKANYDLAAQAKALKLSLAYVKYEDQLKSAIGDENIPEKAAWNLAVSQEKKASYESFRKTVLLETAKLSKLTDRQDETLYYRLQDLFYRTQVKEMKERYLYFNFVDYESFHTAYKKNFESYKRLKGSDDKAYAHWRDSLNYALKCQSLDKTFKLPTEFGRDGITLVIQQGYFVARLSQGRGSQEEMKRKDWAWFYQLILAASRAGVYSHFMGREVIERLAEKGVFSEEIRKAPEDVYCRFWRGMKGPVVGNARLNTDDARKIHEIYQRMLSECIADLNFALASDSLNEVFRSVALTERLYLYLKKIGHARTIKKLKGLEAIQKEMEWAIGRHPTPELPLNLLIKFRRDWKVTKHLEELDRVQQYIAERWRLSKTGAAAGAVSGLIGKERSTDDPLHPMTSAEHKSLNHRLIRAQANRLNVHGDNAEALVLIEKGLKIRVRADLLCEKAHAHLGLGQIKLARSAYQSLIETHGDEKPIVYWGEDRLKSLRVAMEALPGKSGE
ncbi:MAG: hypothetical protein P1V97_34575, partial [Planctomycetota bacterium]|nr:hypothetical protein [Planctomycetota bacterium]